MSVSICYHSSLLGSEKSLHVCDENYEWVLRRPQGSWVRAGRASDGTDLRSVDDAFLLEKVVVAAQPPSKFTKSLVGLPEGQLPMWSFLMPNKAWKTWVGEVVDSTQESLTTLDSRYYRETWNHHSALFSAMRSFSPPQPQFFSVDVPEAQSFRARGGRCERITYNRFGTRTGRLTVESGPQIQTLRKDARKFLMSKWEENGVLASFDFSALEARVLNAHLTGAVSSQDPYDTLAAQLGSGFDRGSAKTALISIMYGAGANGLAHSLGVSREEAARVHDTVTSALGVKQFIASLRREHYERGFIRNKYHRRVDTPDSSDGVLLNSYVQSTAADVALYGFLEIVKRLDSDVAVPVALLHDALIVDCKRSVVDRLGGLIHVPVPGYEGKFPIKITQFNA